MIINDRHSYYSIYSLVYVTFLFTNNDVENENNDDFDEIMILQQCFNQRKW